MYFQLLSILFGALLLTSNLPAQVISIAQARILPVGSTVTVRGRVTNGKELGRVRYLQDGTAGIAGFPGKGSLAGFERTINNGDSIELSGTLMVYNNLLEISPVTSYRVILPGRSIPKPTPRLIKVADIGPAYEGQLVRLHLRFADHRDTFSSNSNFEVADSSGYRSHVYVPKDSPLAGAPVPAQPIQLIAILSRYKDFQLLPLNLEDYVPNKWQSVVQLDSNIVTTTVVIKNCDAGKITVQDATGKEWQFAIAHSSGTTQLDLTQIPAGSYVAVVRTHGQAFTLPFTKI